jgi:hypothetical protein
MQAVARDWAQFDATSVDIGYTSRNLFFAVAVLVIVVFVVLLW